MKRREFIKSAGVGGVAVAAASTLPKPAIAQKRIEMVIFSGSRDQCTASRQETDRNDRRQNSNQVLCRKRAGWCI